jgi:phosphoribosylformylglycinamidine synthase
MPPDVNLLNEKNNGENMLKLIQANLVLSMHDVSNGGLIVALSEMAMSSKNYGVKIQKPKKLSNLIEYFFGEDQGRYILELEPNNLAKVEKILKDNNVYYENIGYTQKDYFEVEDELKINVKDLFKINNEWYNKY